MNAVWIRNVLTTTTRSRWSNRNGGVKTAAWRTFRRRSTPHSAVKNKRVTVQGPVKKPPMGSMSHRGWRSAVFNFGKFPQFPPQSFLLVHLVSSNMDHRYHNCRRRPSTSPWNWSMNQRQVDTVIQYVLPLGNSATPREKALHITTQSYSNILSHRCGGVAP